MMELGEEVRTVVGEYGRLSVDVSTLTENSSLYEAGMTSHASVNVMLGLENAFDIEFPDRMLRRSVFETMGAMQAAIEELKSEELTAA